MTTAVRSTKSPRELYSMAKHLGVWDPEKIPVVEDRVHWEMLTPEQKEQLTKVCALFYEGEVSVADTLAWFMLGVPDPDRRMFLSTQVFEEVKHAEFFELYFREVCGKIDTAAYLVPEYKGVLIDGLRNRGEEMGRAITSGDKTELTRTLCMFAAHYMGVIEGTMAVTGYDFFDELLQKTGMFPRLHEGLKLIRADEGRHIVHGLDYLHEVLSHHSEYVQPVRDLFMQQAATVPQRTEFIFTPNAFGLDKQRMLQIGYEHIEQRMREAGLA